MNARQILRTGLALLAFVPAALFALARLDVLNISGGFTSPSTHVITVGGAALAAVVAAMLMVYVARRENDARAGLVGVGFLVMAGLLLIHAMATPDFILGEYGRNATVGLAGALAVPAGGIVFAVALMLPARRVAAPRLIARSAGVALLVLVTVGVIGIAHPELIPLIPVSVTPWSYVLLAPACFVYAWLARRTWHTYQLTRRITDAMVAVGLVWLGTSIPVYLLSPVWSWLFWGGHALEACGFLAVATAVSRDLTLRRPTLVLPRQTRAQDLLADESALLGGYVKSLTDSLHDHDPTTLIHCRRVAQLAVEIGEHLDLPTDALRRLAVAGLLHDIGKLQVPGAILTKPGPLTDDEYRTIQTHPLAGADLLAHLGSFQEEIPIVLAHHERLDGHGYPNGVAGEHIPLEARILSICDVFDALTSPRPYREAWSRDRALELIVKETGTAFDPMCTAALLAVVVEGNHAAATRAA